MKIVRRALRAALFDRKVFTGAFFDNDAPADGAVVVAGVGAITYVGWWALGVVGFSITGLFSVLLASVISWLILAFATWFAATRLFGSSNRPQTMMAMHGLAALPLVLDIFGGAAGGLIAGVGLVWYVAVLVVATREAADVGLKEAAVSVLIGFAVAALVRMLIGVPFALIGSLFG